MHLTKKLLKASYRDLRMFVAAKSLANKNRWKSTDMRAITLVTGSFPPDACGVGDYTAKLQNAFNQQGITASCYSARNWRITAMWQRWKALLPIDDLLLMQYPTIGFENRLLPYLIWPLLFWKKKAVTLHEFSRKSFIGKSLCYFFFIFSKRLIFTTDEERNQAIKRAPWIAKRAKTIPIGSNIPFIARCTIDTDVAFFGLIFPGKGIEEFIEIVTELSKQRSLRIKLVGQVFRGAEEFAKSITAQLKPLGASVIINADEQTVAQILAGSQTALLPFPDGISMRRGSALAALGNGALVITTQAHSEFAAFEGRCLMGKNTAELTQLLNAALENPEDFQAVADAGRQYAQSYDWANIATQYLDFLSATPGAKLK
jgi:glycosyltransferase involved in cell wall biosynthesis